MWCALAVVNTLGGHLPIGVFWCFFMVVGSLFQLENTPNPFVTWTKQPGQVLPLGRFYQLTNSAQALSIDHEWFGPGLQWWFCQGTKWVLGKQAHGFFCQ